MSDIKDTYKTIKAEAEGLFKDKGSKFITYAYPITEESQVKEHIDVLKKEHYSARHHCYAWRLGIEGEKFRANDDGEPSGSAGRPILGQLQSLELTNILVVVVRYFGGTLLGVPGLINAYKKGTLAAIENADIEERIAEDLILVNYDYLVMNDVMKIIKDFQLEQVKTEFDLTCKVTLATRLTITDSVIEKLEKIDSVVVDKVGIR